MGRPRRHHVVPKAYIAGWADGGLIAAHDVQERRTFSASARDLGVMKNFYRRVGADGEADDDIERHIAIGETHGLPVLRTIEERWPLALVDKAHLAALLAVQLVRGIRFRATQDRTLQRSGPSMRSRLRSKLVSDGWRLPNGQIITEEQFDSEFDAGMVRMGENNERLTQMLHPVENIASVLGSMQWSLLTFDGPVLATADEPVTVWPRSDITSVPRSWPTTTGLLRSLEMRFPVSPSLALLLTWLDEPDGTMSRAPLSFARNLNAFTIAQASRQWFFVPGEMPQLPNGRPVLAPLAPMIHPGYGAANAELSTRRVDIDQYVNGRLGAEPVGRVRVRSVVRRAGVGSS